MEPRRRPPFVVAVQDHQHRSELEGSQCGRVVAGRESGGDEEMEVDGVERYPVVSFRKGCDSVREHLSSAEVLG
eukprot:817334-Rhodomonas_salina.1